MPHILVSNKKYIYLQHLSCRNIRITIHFLTKNHKEKRSVNWIFFSPQISQVASSSLFPLILKHCCFFTTFLFTFLLSPHRDFLLCFSSFSLFSCSSSSFEDKPRKKKQTNTHIRIDRKRERNCQL